MSAGSLQAKPLSRAEIFCIAKAENRKDDKAEEEQADARSGPLAECLRKLDAGINKDRGNENTENREQAYAVSQSDFANVIGVQNGDQAVPPGDPGFHKDFPCACDCKDTQHQGDNIDDRAAGVSAVAVAFYIFPPVQNLKRL